MNIIPIAFAFDNNMIMPACVCISSLLMSANPDTFCDIFILHSEHEDLKHEDLDRLSSHYPNCRIQYRKVGKIFDKAYEIRGITTAAYYRLLIPEVIPEYDKVMYSDVDVIFRDDISDYYKIDLKDNFIAGVDSLAHLDKDTKDYYIELGIGDRGVIYSGNIIINSKLIRECNILDAIKECAQHGYKFQDMDVLNIVCKDRIHYLSPAFCTTTYFYNYKILNKEELTNVWSPEEIEYASCKGIVHYNGQKPWKSYCINFDIWWEYYRKSIFFDEKFYYNFFNEKLEEYDRLSLVKRIKILIRYFVRGRK